MSPQQPPWSEDDEAAFRRWYAQVAQQRGLDPNPDDQRHYYDWRAAYRTGAQADPSGHWPSTFKRIGHPNLVVDGQDTRTGQPFMQSPDVMKALLLMALQMPRH